MMIQKKKIIKLYNSLGGRIANLEVPSSQKFLIPELYQNSVAQMGVEWGSLKV